MIWRTWPRPAIGRAVAAAADAALLATRAQIEGDAMSEEHFRRRMEEHMADAEAELERWRQLRLPAPK